MAGLVDFSVLGPIEVRRADGSLVDLGGRQSRLVLARLLVAEGRVVLADAVVEAVWGPTPPESAPGTLQTYVSRLRKALGRDGAELLRFEASGYRLAVVPEQVDARRFERLAEQGSRLLASGKVGEAAQVLRGALGLWRGDVLGDYDAEFVRSAAARWQDLRLTASEDLFDAELRAGRATAIIAHLSDAVAASPLRERLRGLLALALYRSGRQAEALAVLDEGRRVLRDELGLDLSRNLRDLQDLILAQDHSLDHPPGRVFDPPDQPTAPTSAEPTVRPTTEAPAPVLAPPRRADELIGRMTELDIMIAALDEAFSGRKCRHVIIEGEPGIGKTTLAQELLLHAERVGARTVTAATLEIGAAPAYGPWLQVLRAASALVGELPASVSRLLDGSAQSLLPTSQSVIASALAGGTAQAVSEVAGSQGLAILLEDMQWADPASLDLLGSLGSRLSDAPVVIVVTIRDVEVGRDDNLVEALAQLMRRPGTRRISLRGLSIAETGRLLARTAGSDVPGDVVAAVHARSEGNPFFTTELARMIGERGALDSASVRATSVPTGVRDVLQRRVARLPQSTGRLLETAAVLGRQVDLELLAAVADRSLDECLDDLEPALITRLLEVPTSAPGAVRFTHALVREALSEGMSALRRARLHMRAADGITAAVGETDDTSEIIAEHLWHAAAVGVSARAAAALERAAQVALKRQALVSAESSLTRAATLYRAAGTESGLAELRVLRQLGFVGAALHGYAVNADSPLVRRARELARATVRPDILLDLIWADWAGCDTGGQPWRGIRLVEEAEALVADLDDPLLHAGAASMRGFTERHFGRMQSAYEHIDKAVRLFDRSRVAQEAGFYLNGYLTSKGFRHWAGALTRGLDRDGLEQLYREQDLPFARMVIGLFGASATMAVDDRPGVQLWAERMMAADPDGLLSFWSAAAELYTALGMLQGGRIDAGLARYTTGLQHMRAAQARTTLAGLDAAAAQALVDAGDLDNGRRLLELAIREIEETGEQVYRPFVTLAAAHLAAAEADLPRALQLIDRAVEVATEHGSLSIIARFERDRAALLERQRVS